MAAMHLSLFGQVTVRMTPFDPFNGMVNALPTSLSFTVNSNFADLIKREYHRHKKLVLAANTWPIYIHAGGRPLNCSNLAMRRVY